MGEKVKTILKREDLCTRWGVSPSYLVKLEHEGILKRLPRFNSPFYSLAHVEELESTGIEDSNRRYKREMEKLRMENVALQGIIESMRKILGA